MAKFFCSPIGNKAKQYSPTTYQGHNSAAIDIPVPMNTPVYAMASGKVYSCDDIQSNEPDKEANGGRGNYIQLEVPPRNWGYDESEILYIRYLHLMQNGVLVQQGQQVNQGDIIGYSGNSGNSSGPHLHIDLSNSIGGNSVIQVNEDNCSNFKELSELNTIKTLKQLQGSGINSYTYYIFGQEPIISQQISNGNELIKIGQIPNSYYTDDFTNKITNGTNRNFTEMIDIASGLCCREIGFRTDDSLDKKESLSGISIYAKLLRARLTVDSQNSLNHVFQVGGFTGFQYQSLNNRKDITEDFKAKIKDSVQKNLCYPQAYNILQKYLYIVNNAPYFNYGYAGLGYPQNTSSIEEKLTNEILNKQIISHITIGNSKHLIGCVGNTAYFSNNNWL